MNGISVIQRKETRGKLVMMLYNQYGRWTQGGTLINALARGLSNADTEVPNQLLYLADEQKGFVVIQYPETTGAELASMRDAYVQLTARGVNLVEGDIDDPGIIFGDGQRS